MAAEEKHAEPLISHSIGLQQGFDLELLSSSRRERGRDWGF